jgi:Zn-dependent M28 family amino/carboxypeptidase
MFVYERFFGSRLFTNHIPEVKVAMNGSNSFAVYLKGRSPALALDDRGYRESISFDVVIYRDFDSPNNVMAAVVNMDATQTPWPDNDQEVDSSKFSRFADNQLVELDRFTRQYSTFISECVGKKH